MSKDKTLFLFTITFPFGKMDDYLEDEMEVLSQRFKQVVILPLQPEGDQVFKLPPNVVVEKFSIYQPFNRVKALFKYLPKVIQVFTIQILFSRHRIKYLFGFFEHLNNLLHRCYIADQLNEHLEKKFDKSNGVFYSYWYNIWMSILPILRSDNKINHLVSRIHGGDLYEERQEKGYYPFRTFQFKYTDAIAPVSDAGLKYLLERYRVPNLAKKIEVARLGTRRKSLTVGNNAPPYNIVSCSNFVPLKRVHLIIETLSNINIPINWVHFGDGPLKSQLIDQAQKLPSNIKWEFPGHSTLDTIFDFYKNNKIDFFINVSETEGIPVSIMEAISFGIPIIATNVGGTAEVVNERTGLLIPKNFDAKWLSNTIMEIINQQLFSQTYRAGIRSFWENNYAADINYPKFADTVLLNKK